MTSSLRNLLHRMSSLFSVACIVFCFLQVPAAGAQDIFDLPSLTIGDSIKSENLLLKHARELELREQRSIKNLWRWSAEARDEARACVATYDKLTSGKELRIHLAFGYHDNKKDVLDGYIFYAVAKTLLRPCETSRSVLCGFAVRSGGLQGPFLELQKSIWYYKAHSRKQINAIVTLARASVYRADGYNVTAAGPTPEQAAQSALVDEFFYSSISGKKSDGTVVPRCDVCMYYGHARNGGGPDFKPVPWARRDSQGETTYDQYMSEKEGYRKLLKSLSEAVSTNPPQLLALQACYSQIHFYDRKACIKNAPGCEAMSLKKFEDKMGLVLTSDYSWPQNYGKTISLVLDTVLGFKCRSAFDENNAAINFGKKKNLEAFSLRGNFLDIKWSKVAQQEETNKTQRAKEDAGSATTRKKADPQRVITPAQKPKIKPKSEPAKDVRR